MRIAIAGFATETHTWYPEPTTLADFEHDGIARGPSVIESNRGVRSYINGCLETLEALGAEPVGILDASAPVANRLTEETYETLAGEIVAGLTGAGSLNGVILCLHGAMAVEHLPRPEAELVRRVRAAVGDLPIMVTLDLHANEDHELTDAADAVFICKQYPHVDAPETGAAAARCMVGTLKGEIRPVSVLVKPGIVSPSVFQGTGTYPMRAVRARADAWEQHPRVIYMSVATGFAYADVPDIGASVVAVTDGDAELARTAACDVADFMWSVRRDLASRPLPGPAEAVTRAVELARGGRRPVVLADHSDRTGDSTHILRELLAQGAQRFAVSSLADPEAVAACTAVGEGREITVKVGGWASPYAGEPVAVTGTVVHVGSGEYRLTGPMSTGSLVKVGPAATLRLPGDGYVVLTTHKHQGLDDGAFRAFGVPFDDLDIMVLKTRVHFRAYYEASAGAILEVDAPGLGPADLRQLTYRHAPADAYPIGRIWR